MKSANMNYNSQTPNTTDKTKVVEQQIYSTTAKKLDESNNFT